MNGLTATYRRAALFGAIAVFLSLVFFGLIAWRTRIAYSQTLSSYGRRQVVVCTAAHTLKTGSEITASSLRYKRWVGVLLPKGAVLKGHESSLIGRRTNALILAGEPLVSARVVSKRHRLDSLLPGQSAVTLEADSVRALGGEITPGMYVTVMGTPRAGATCVLAQHVRVLSTSNADEKKSSGLLGGEGNSAVTWVTVAVPDATVAQVITASQAGETYLVKSRDIRARLGANAAKSARSDETTGALQ